MAAGGANALDRGAAPDGVTFLPQLPHHLKYRVFLEPLAVCQMAPDARIPAWPPGGGFFSVVRARDETSIVCPENDSADRVRLEDRMPAGSEIERGWVALKLEGPFPFSMTGVLASFIEPLAVAQIPIFAISTFATDYVLIKRERLEQAVGALGAAGHKNLGDQAP